MTEISSQAPSIQTLYGWYREGRLMVNRNYQRKLVWTLQERQKLIDSIERRYPIPLVLLAEADHEGRTVYEIIDGLQRLHSIMAFIENGFPDESGRFFNVDEFPTAKEQSDQGKFEKATDNLLTRAEITTILDYSIPISIIQKAEAGVITDVFGRINTYGHRLSDQEQRQAGQLTLIARFVRTLSSEIRGDVSIDTVALFDMPEISIDLPKSRAGYAVDASKVWWNKQGVLRSTDLRDSMDEQLVADLAICIADRTVERAKEVLDSSFDPNDPIGQRVASALGAYGVDRLSREIKYCLETIQKIVESSTSVTLSRLVFSTPTNNSFPTLFVVICTAIHRLIFKESKLPADFAAAAAALNNVADVMETQRNAEARERNIASLQGRLNGSFAPGDIAVAVHSGNREIDLINTIKRSRIESSHFELKQGVCRLDGTGTVDPAVYEKIVHTLGAIANNALATDGAVVIGVADSLADAERIRDTQGVPLSEINGRYVVGIERELPFVGVDEEGYYHRWRDAIQNSDLPDSFKSDVLSKMAMCDLCGHRVLFISVPPQTRPTFEGSKIFVRDGDQTVEKTAADVLGIAARFGH